MYRIPCVHGVRIPCTRGVLRVLAVLTVLGLSLWPVPVLAIAQPTTPSDVRSAYAYRNLLETGDQGYLIDYYIDYPALGLPTETATEAYIFTLVAVDGVTQIRSVAPYTFVDSGYLRGLAWVYFSAADAPAWNQAYSIWLSGNPTLTWTPTATPPKTVANVDYWQVSTDPEAELVSRILYLADQLELAWGLDVITTSGSGGSYLTTSVGEPYFTSVVQSLRQMTSVVFSAGETTPIREGYDYGTGGSQGLAAALVGTPLDFTNLANVMGIPLTTVNFFVWALVMGVGMYFVVRYLGAKPAVVFFDFGVVAGALFGLPLIISALMATLAVIATGFILFYRGSTA